MIARRLITALFMALLVSGVFTFWLSRKFAKPHAAAPTKQQYVAAAQNLEAGDLLRPANLKLVEWPTSAPLDGAFAKPEDVAGRIVLYPLASGQPILERQLSAAGSGAGLSSKIPEGMRAISLKSDQVVGVAGFLLPGTHVDVLVTYHSPMSPEPITSMVIQDAQILAAGQKMQPDPEGKANSVDVVTLLVKPEDAEKVVLASAQGTVHFVLRNGSDHEQVIDQSAHLSQFGGEVQAKNLVPPSPRKELISTLPKTYVVKTVYGDKQTTDTF